MPPKTCPPNKIANPAGKRCVVKTYDALLAHYMGEKNEKKRFTMLAKDLKVNPSVYVAKMMKMKPKERKSSFEVDVSMLDHVKSKPKNANKFEAYKSVKKRKEKVKRSFCLVYHSKMPLSKSSRAASKDLTINLRDGKTMTVKKGESSKVSSGVGLLDAEKNKKAKKSGKFTPTCRPTTGHSNTIGRYHGDFLSAARKAGGKILKKLHKKKKGTVSVDVVIRETTAGSEKKLRGYTITRTPLAEPLLVKKKIKGGVVEYTVDYELTATKNIPVVEKYKSILNAKIKASPKEYFDEVYPELSTRKRNAAIKIHSKAKPAAKKPATKKKPTANKTTAPSLMNLFRPAPTPPPAPKKTAPAPALRKSSRAKKQPDRLGSFVKK